MDTISSELTNWLRAGFESALGIAPDETELVCVRQASKAQFGDYQCNDVMRFAKARARNPRDIAQEIMDALGTHPLVAKTEMAGAGYINIFLEDTALSARALDVLGDLELGLPQHGAGRCVVVDYSSPNVAKPMHIAHIRSTVIGNALDRMYRQLGYRVVSDNHIGDWGTQFGKLIMGYRHFLDRGAYESDPISELERIYVASHIRCESDEEWINQCRAELVKLQQGDMENTALWKEFLRLSLNEFDTIYRRLDVRFDLVRGESYYNEALPGLVAELEQSGMAVESEGALVVNLESENLGVCIVRKNDGGFNYATTDLATVASREAEFAPDIILYVTDQRQAQHFRQIFHVARRRGCKAELVHLGFGLMRLPDGLFSTRAGNAIKLEQYLDEAERRALVVVNASSPHMSDEQRREVARAVGIGAVKYADLSQNPASDIQFEWDKALNLEGNSAPYLQYAHARIRSVLDRFAEQFPGVDLGAFALTLAHPLERQLALKCQQFGESLLAAVQNHRPNLLADYLFELAQQYSSFYQNLPFLKAEPGVRESRLRLCLLVAETLQRGLYLLGIPAPNRI